MNDSIIGINYGVSSWTSWKIRRVNQTSTYPKLSFETSAPYQEIVANKHILSETSNLQDFKVY